MATLPNKNPLADLSGGYYAYWTDGTTEGRATLAVILGSTDAQAAAAALGSLTLGTDLAVAHGGTGASTASDARDNLGLTIGTNVQAWDADLDSIAALDPSANKIIYKDGGSNWATATLTSFARTLIDDSNAATARATLGVDAAGTDNSTDVTIAAGLDYITISGQELTLGSVDLTTDVTGALPDGNIATAANWNTAYTHSQVTSGNPHSVTKSDVGLGNVENTALSTWAGSANITTLGTIGTGVWQGTAIANAYVAGIDQNLLTTSSPTFAGLTVTSANNTPQITIADATGDAQVKDGFIVLPHYTASEEPIMLIGGRSNNANLNYVNIGGYSDVSGVANAATNVRIYAAATSTTNTGGTKIGEFTISGFTVLSDLTLAAGSITSASGAISFGNENLSTTGTLSAGNTSITGTLGVSAAVRFGTDAVTADTDADDLVLEVTSGKSGMSVIGPDAQAVRYVLGSPSLPYGAGLTWNYSSNSFQIGTQKAGASTVLTSGANVTALTLDSSQNATFAGNVYGKSSTVNTSWAFDGATDGGIAVGAGYADGRLYAEGSQSASLVLHDSGGTANLRTIALQINGDSAKLYGYNDSGTLRHSWIEMNQSTGDMTLGAGDLKFTTAATNGIIFDNLDNANVPGIEWRNADASRALTVGLLTEANGTYARKDLVVYTKGTADWTTAATETARFTQDGNTILTGDLRIGTTSTTSHQNEVLRVSGTAGARLANIHRGDSGAAWLHFTNTTTGTTTNDGFNIGIESDESAVIKNDESTPMRFYTASTERFRVAADAYALGIGTTDVESWSASFAAIEFGQSAIWASNSGSSLHMGANHYYDGSYKYKATGATSRQNFDSSGNILWATAASGTADSTITWSERMRLTNAGMLLVGDTANANMTVGLTLNQGANDDEILAFKSSDVAHGYTTGAETDTWFMARKSSGTAGGMEARVFMENAAEQVAFRWDVFGGQASTTHSSAGRSLIEFSATQHNGSNSLSAITADGNVFGIRGNVAGSYRTLFLIDEDGDFHYDGADGGAFDVYEDAHLVRAFANATSKETVRTAHDDWVQYNEQTLVDIGVLGAPVSEGGLINGAQLQRVHTGAIWQNYMAISDTKTEVEVLRDRLADTESRLAIAESKLKQLPQA